MTVDQEDVHAIRRLAQRYGRGWGLWRLWHVPRDYLALLRKRGLGELRIDAEAERQMCEAALRLPSLTSLSGAPVTLHFLTGARFWQQTIFCAWTFAFHSDVPLQIHVYDDGSLTSLHHEHFLRLFPETVFHHPNDVRERLDQVLPVNRYPVIRELRESMPLMRKLTDIHAGRTGWRLLIDSDLLFFRRPSFLLDWLQNPSQPVFMKDMMSSYGYNMQVLERLASGPIPERFNAGIAGQCSDQLDWELMESMCRTLIRAGGREYLIEQTLTMILATRGPFLFCPEPDYICNPGPAELEARTAVMHHYVGPSKIDYRRRMWRTVAAEAATAPSAGK